MDLNTYMGYRVGEQEIEQAALRAERARIAAARPEQRIARPGVLRRAAQTLSGSRAAASRSRGTAGAETAAGGCAPHPA